MTIAVFLPLGLLVGVVVHVMLQGAQTRGWQTSMLIGGAGSVLGYCIGRMAKLYREGEGAGYVACLVGAAALVATYHVATMWRSRARSRLIR